MYSYGPPHMAVQKQDDQHEHTFSSYVRIRDVVLKTYLGRWTIGRSGERGSGISVLPARYDECYMVFPYFYDVYGLNSTPIFLLQGWLGHWITHEDLYTIKQRNWNKHSFCPQHPLPHGLYIYIYIYIYIRIVRFDSHT